MQIFSAINYRSVRRKLAHISLTVMFLLSQFTPALALAPVVEPPVSLPPQLVPPQPVGGVKTGPRTVTHFTAKSDLSTDPSDLEISTTRIFSEPLAPMSSAAVAGENQAIVKLVQSLKSRRNPEDVAALTDFISAFPNSRWRPSIESNLADMYLGTGYLTRSIAGWESVWEKTKSEKNSAQIAVANHAMANLLNMYAQLGMKEVLKSRFVEIEGRPFFGSDETKINGAHIGYMIKTGRRQLP